MAKIQEALSNKFTNMSFLCACLVVLIHLWFPVEPEYGAHWWGIDLSVRGVSRMAVPYFFLVAGYFLAHHCDEEGWWGREVRKRVRSLLVPMFLWSFLYEGLSFTGFVAWRVLRGMPVGEAVGMYPIEWLRVLCLSLYRTPCLGPLWFLRGLFLFVLLSPLLVSVIRRGRKWGLLLLGVCVGLYLAFPRGYGENDLRNFFRFFFSVEGLVYFTLGLFLYRWPVKLRLSKGVALGALAGAVGLYVLSLAGHLFMSNRLCAYVRIVAIAVEMLAVWRLIPERLMLPRAVLATSFPIYLMHRFLIRVLECEAVTQTFPAFMRSTFWGYALQCSGTVVVCVGVALLWKRCFPRSAALFFGGRG